MPWGLILTVGLQLINWLFSNEQKKAQARRKFIDFIESRSASHKGPLNARLQSEKQKLDLERQRLEKEHDENL